MIVTLICVKEGSRLRVKILSDGYIKNANCQFPRSIREEGAIYHVDSEYVNLHTSRGRYFYSVKKLSEITIVSNHPINLTIYENEEETECVICVSSLKDTVFVPCGHYYCCSSCSQQLDKCPICRSVLTRCINRSLVD
jgi:hypothetical protein